MMISGGKNENGVLMNDVWVSDDAGTTWIQTTAAPWSARSAFGFASVPLGAPLAGRVVLVAGSTAPSVVTNDVWVSDSAADSLSGITWTQAVAVAPFSPRSKLGFVVMPDTGMLVVAGAFVRSFFLGFSARALRVFVPACAVFMLQLLTHHAIRHVNRRRIVAVNWHVGYRAE